MIHSFWVIPESRFFLMWPKHPLYHYLSGVLLNLAFCYYFYFCADDMYFKEISRIYVYVSVTVAWHKTTKRGFHFFILTTSHLMLFLFFRSKTTTRDIHAFQSSSNVNIYSKKLRLTNTLNGPYRWSQWYQQLKIYLISWVYINGKECRA